jgi:lysophospholipase L1-like esterase
VFYIRWEPATAISAVLEHLFYVDARRYNVSMQASSGVGRIASKGVLSAAMLLAVGGDVHAAAAPNLGDQWLRSWGAAVMAPEEFDYYPGLSRTFQDATIRQVIVTTLGGAALRVGISNEFGTKPLVIGRARVARARTGPRVDPASDRELTFSGARSVIVPAGATLVSDAVDLKTQAGETLAVSLYLPESTAGSTATVHEEGWRTGYLSPTGDFTSRPEFPVEARLVSYFYLAAVDVNVQPGAAAIVVLGDSITDGTGATPRAGRAWPDDLARRLRTQNLSVINMGIGGNRLLHPSTGPSALARLNRDVLTVPGLRFLIVLEGINDIAGWPEHPEEDVSAADIEDALREVIDRAHAHGVKVFGGTITATLGCPDCGGPAGEMTRQAVNAWIRHSGAFDAVLDFDRATSDPAERRRLRPEFDSGDHLHPSDAGYQAMADSIDLSIFRMQ